MIILHFKTSVYLNPLQVLKQQFSDSYENTKKHRIPKTILNNQRTIEGPTILDFKLHYKTIVLKKAWY